MSKPTANGVPGDHTLDRMPPVRSGLGILGGTFDPPHIGHLAAAVEVRSSLDLDRVLLVVANEPWQKVGTRPFSLAADRFALTMAAAEGLEGIAASDREIVRGGPTYSIDTLLELRQEEPDTELFLIVGADAATSLHTWQRHEELPELATLVIVDRLGDSRAEVPAGWRIERVTMPRLDVSSSDVRSRAADGRSLAPYVTPAVVDEISRRGLYGLADS